MIRSEESRFSGFNPSLSRSSSSPKYYKSFRTSPYPIEEISLIGGPELDVQETGEAEGLELDTEVPYFNNPFVLYYSNKSCAFEAEDRVVGGDCGDDLNLEQGPLPAERGLCSIRTDKRRINRVCSFLAVFLGLGLLLSSLLQSNILPVRTAASSDNRDSEFILSPQAWSSHQHHQPPESKLKRLPQCVIIGARKCGTRALIDMLNLHPQVEKAAVEVHFFDRDDNYGKGLDWYREHMPETSEDQISIEKSPSYFVTPEVPERIHGMNSSIKLLLIVREPVTRVISDYTQIYGTNSKPHNGSKSPRLEDLVLSPDGSVNVHYKAVRISLYARYLQRWFDVFPPSQIHVIDGDALIRDPLPVLKDVERFLGLAPRLHRDNFYFNATKGFYCWRRLEGSTGVTPSSASDPALPISSSSTSRRTEEGSRNETSSSMTGLHCLNDSKGRPHPVVDRHIVSKLRRFYNPHNLRFYDMVSRDFGWPEK